MGQFLDYIASVFTSNNKVEAGTTTTATTTPSSKDKSLHVTFADSAFGQVFNRSSNAEKAPDKVTLLTQSNWRTIYIYQSIGALAFLAQLCMVTVPRIRLETFDLLESDGWQLVTLSLIPFIVQLASIGAMHEINQPISEGTKLTAKNSGLDLNNNQFIHSLKIVIVLMAACQLSSIFSDQFIWSAVMIVPLWCYQLTTRMAHSEYARFAPTQKKQWASKLNLSRSPKNTSPTSSPRKQAAQVDDATKADSALRATPRTRTKRAVKNIITGVSDKYHAFEQNVAHQLSQKIFTPLSPKLKMIE